MRNTFPFFAALVLAGAMVSGCANQERKLGRGINNTMELTRWGEYRKTMEMTALDYEPDYAYTTGAIKGVDRSVGRIGLGLYEIITFPFPTPGHGYDPLFTDTFTPGSVYPDNYKPGLIEDSMFATDSNLGFSGGDFLPFVPGSRFKVFETH